MMSTRELVWSHLSNFTVC